MWTESLRLKGFRGIRDGLGRDEITLDFEQLAGAAALVALNGPNGRGKTTIMDNLHPFPVMPSRASQGGLESFSYYDHLCLSEAEKDLVWRHEGRRFRSHLVFRMNVKKKTEAFLLEWIDHAWKPVTIDDGTVSDGKMDTYWRCIVTVLKGAETFFTSVFSAQGRRPLSAYKSSEIKSLLAELLGHAALREQAARAGEVAKLLKSGLVTVRAALVDLDSQWAAVQQARAGMAPAQADQAQAGRARDLAQSARLQAGQTLERLHSLAAADANNARQRSDIQTQLRRIDEGWKSAVGQLDGQKAAEERRQTALSRRIADRLRKADTERSALQTRRHGLEAVLADAGRTQRATRRREVLARVLVRRLEDEARCREQSQRMRELETAAKGLRTQIHGIERQAGQASLSAEDLKRRLGLTNEVPCVGTDLQGRCKLLGDAMQARALMPTANQKIAQMQRERDAAKAELNGLETQGRALADAAGQFAIAEWKRARTAASVQTVERWCARQSEIDRARRDRVDVEQQMAAIGARDSQPTADERDEAQAIQEALERIAVGRETEDKKRRVETARLSEQLQHLPLAFDLARLKQAQADVETAQGALEAADRLLIQKVRALQSLSDASGKADGLEPRLAQARGRVARVEAQIGIWSMLAKALGNDGIVALSIDDAGPTLSGLANDLLLSCYGPRFTVSLKTQVETTKGELREGFSIVVHDAQSGESKELDHMSGGERVWINECLTRAIALYLAQNSGCRYETLFSDEADGPLDEERKRMFMAMKREVLRLGGYRREFFISQTPELTAMADAVIDLDEMWEEVVS